MHPDTPTLFVVVAGQIRFDVEGQQPVTATRGSLVNIMKTTLYSYDVTRRQERAVGGSQSAQLSERLSLVGSAARAPAGARS